VSDAEVCTCGGQLEDQGFEFVSVPEMPVCPRAVIKGFRVHLKGCTCCGRKYRGRHEEIAENQYGATAHRFGWLDATGRFSITEDKAGFHAIGSK